MIDATPPELLEDLAPAEVEELYIDMSPLSPEDEEALIKKLASEYSKFTADIKRYHNDLEKWHRIYEAPIEPKKEFPWEGASSFTVPLAKSVIDSAQARIAKSVFDVDPLFIASPRTAASSDTAKVVEKYLDYWMDEMDAPRVLDGVITSMLIEGTGFVKVDWERDIYQVYVDGEPSDVVRYDGPALRHIPARDFVMMPADAPTIDQAVYTGHRVFLTYQQLLDRMNAGLYFNVSKLLDKSKGDSTHDRVSNRHNIVVSSQTGSSEYPETAQYEIVELYGPYDFGDGPEPAVMTFSPKHNVLLRVEPNPYQYDRPLYIDFCVYPKPNSVWGFSMAEMLQSAQEELTMMHNARADALAISISPPIARPMGSLWDPEEEEWGPGATITYGTPNEIHPIAVPGVPHTAFQHEQDILQFVERLTGLSDYHMGTSPSKGRTATEVNRVTSEGLARLDGMISRFQHGGMRRLAWAVWWLVFQFRPWLDYFYHEGQQYTISKADKSPQPNGMMAFELQPHGVLSDISREARRSQKLMLLNTSAPILMQHYPDGVQELLRDIFEEFDIKDSERILGPPWEALQQMMEQVTQQAYQQGMQDGQQAIRQQG